MVEAGVPRPLALYESAMRLLAGKRSFEQAIAVFDRLEKDGYQSSPTTLSCVVGFTCELGDRARAASFFQQLCDREPPPVRACMAMLRLYAKQNDWKSSYALLLRIRELGANLDSIVFNTALSTGVAAGEIESVEAVLGQDASTHVADVISYNIVMKGLAQICEVDKTMRLLYEMVQKGMQPNIITFNTAIDAAVRAHRADDAWRLYDLMVNDMKLRADKYTCTTLSKTVYRASAGMAERLEMFANLVDDVLPECLAKLQENLLSCCFDAALRLSSAAIAFRCFENLLKCGFRVSSADWRRLLVVLARAEDEEGCRNVILKARNDGELDALRQSIDKHMKAGRSLLEATLLADTTASAIDDASTKTSAHTRKAQRRAQDMQRAQGTVL